MRTTFRCRMMVILLSLATMSLPAQQQTSTIPDAPKPHKPGPSSKPPANRSADVQPPPYDRPTQVADADSSEKNSDGTKTSTARADAKKGEKKSAQGKSAKRPQE